MRRKNSKIQTVFILDHKDGFFFFDPKKEGIVYSIKRMCREDMNLQRDEAERLIYKITKSARIPIIDGSTRWLNAFPATEKSVLFGIEKHVTIRPLIATTNNIGTLRGVRGVSQLHEHPYYPIFPETPQSQHKQKRQSA